MSADGWKEALKALLPPGRAWTRAPGTVMDRLLGALAQEYARLDARTDDLLRETDPRTTSEMLADFERVLKLPDRDAPADQTAGERRDAVVGKLTARGGQTEAYFIAVAAALGYDITINTFDPFTCDSDVDGYLFDDDWQFVWEIIGAALNVRTLRTGRGRCGEPLRTWTDNPLARALGRIMPAHTVLLFPEES